MEITFPKINKFEFGVTLLIFLISALFGVAIAFFDAQYFFADYIAVRIVYFWLVVLAAFIVFKQYNKWGWDFLFSPMTWVLIGFIFFLTLTPLFYPQEFEVYTNPNQYIRLFLTTWLGILLFSTSYTFAPTITTGFISDWLFKPILINKLTKLILIAIGIYWIAQYFISISGGFSFFEYLLMDRYLLGDKYELQKLFGNVYYLRLIVGIIPSAITIPAIYCLLNPMVGKFNKSFIASGFILILFKAVLAGGRFSMAKEIISPIIYLMVKDENKQYLSRRNLAIGSIAILLVMILAMVQISSRYKGITSVLSGDFKPMSALKRNLVTHTVDQNFVMHRILQAEQSGDLEHVLGESYVLTFVAFIPRSLWSGKPAGPDMYEKLSNINPFPNYNISYSVLGEMIVNFGLISIIPGMLIFGFSAGIWWNIFQKNRHSDKMQILYSWSVLSFAFMVRGNFHDTAGSLLYTLFAMIILLSFSTE
ncbi:MAG: O-antigen polymerase [Anaerolineales bacterium]